jgi:hypothetical protein
MKWLSLLCFAASIHSYQLQNNNHNFKIDIPDSWKHQEESHPGGKGMKQIFSAHSKKTYDFFMERFYTETLYISVQTHRADLYYEDLEDKEARDATLRHLEGEIRSKMRSLNSFISPVKNRRMYQKDNNYYFEIEYTDRDKLRESQGFYYHIYTPNAVFGITLLCPDSGQFRKYKDHLQEIINSFAPLHI